MNSKDELPPVSDFVKTLLIVLLAEFAVCTAVNAVRQWLAPSSSAFLASAAEFTAFGMIAFVALSNIASAAMAAWFRDREEVRPFADVSIFVTASQTLLLLAVCASRGLVFNAAAALVCAAAAPLVALLAPGKLLRPVRPSP